MRRRITLINRLAIALALFALSMLVSDMSGRSHAHLRQHAAERNEKTGTNPTVAIAPRTAFGKSVASSPLNNGSVDSENHFSNVGAVMVVAGPNPFGFPEGLIGFASGTLVHERVFLTAGHFTGPAKFGVPPFIHVFVSLNFNALDQSTWIPVEAQVTHPSLPPCPPPVGCDPTSTGAFQAGDPNIVDLGLVFLSRPVTDVEPAALATLIILETPRVLGHPMTFVGYGFPEPRGTRPFSEWDGLRRFKLSTLDMTLNDVWATWSLPGVVCSGDSGGATFFEPLGDSHTRLVAVASDGGLDCMSKDIRVRLDSPEVQKWIRQTIKNQLGEE
jgi:hypothetical protein